MSHSPDRVRREEEDGGKVIAALTLAAPTSRHAAMIVDAVMSALVEEAVVESSNEGQLIAVFRRDSRNRDGIVPWPILRFMRGRRLGHIMGDEGPPSDEAPPA